MATSRILIYRIGQLGDTIVALPAISAVRSAFPNSEITLLRDAHVGNNYIGAEDVLPQGLIDQYLHYECKDGHTDFQESVELMRTIRSSRFDTLIYLAPRQRKVSQVWRDLFFFRLAGIRFFYGHRGFEELSNARRPLPVVTHESDHLIDRLVASGLLSCTRGGALLDFALTMEEQRFADGWFNRLSGEVSSSTYVGFGPGSKWPSKVWPAEYFVELGRRLTEELDVYPIVFGGEEDYKLGQQLISRWGRGANAAGNLGVRQAGAVLSKCDLYVGNDTGTMHLAAAVGTPCVAVFSAQDWPGRWYPYGDGHTVIRRSVSCEGCQLKECTDEGLRCLTSISVDEVFEACKQTLRLTVAKEDSKVACAG